MALAPSEPAAVVITDAMKQEEEQLHAETVKEEEDRMKQQEQVRMDAELTVRHTAIHYFSSFFSLV